MTSPVAIYQRALDAVSRATLAGDFAAYLAQIDLPYLLCTQDAQFVLRDAAALEPTFRAVHDMLLRNGATHYERVARTAVLARFDRIEGQHFTHVIADGTRITAPWAARQALVLRPQGWLFTEAHYPFPANRLPLTEDMVLRSLTEEPALAPTGAWVG